MFSPLQLNQHYSLYKIPAFLEKLDSTSVLRRIIEIAVRAGTFAISVRQLSDLGVALKGEEDFVTRVDYSNQDYLVAELISANLSSLLDSEGIMRLGFVLEEDTQSSRQHAAKGTEDILIYIDPIDGTTSYKDGGDDFCVGLSVERATGENLYAVIYIPVREEIIVAEHVTKSAYRYGVDGNKLAFAPAQFSGSLTSERIAAHYNPPYREKLLEFYSALAGRPVQWFSEVKNSTERFGANTVPGSLMIDLVDLALGKYDLVINGGCHLWDIAPARHVLAHTGHILTDWQGKLIDVARFKGQDQSLQLLAGTPAAIEQFQKTMRQKNVQTTA